jgi:hypothetical protein
MNDLGVVHVIVPAPIQCSIYTIPIPKASPEVIHYCGHIIVIVWPSFSPDLNPY